MLNVSKVVCKQASFYNVSVNKFCQILWESEFKRSTTINKTLCCCDSESFALGHNALDYNLDTVYLIYNYKYNKIYNSKKLKDTDKKCLLTYDAICSSKYHTFIRNNDFEAWEW